MFSCRRGIHRSVRRKKEVENTIVGSFSFLIQWGLIVKTVIYLFNFKSPSPTPVFSQMKYKIIQVTEAKTAHPEFDLAASSFPPLPGSVAPVQGETVSEMRLSDVVRGLKVTTKVTFAAWYFLVFNLLKEKWATKSIASNLLNSLFKGSSSRWLLNQKFKRD